MTDAAVEGAAEAVASDVVIVSGLPRSGTSLMMQMLHAGGVEVLTDHLRAADVDNPRGYFEFERAKRIASDVGWLPEARGKSVKIVSQLLYHLPATERYRVLFMRRDLGEIIASQEQMLLRRNIVPAPRDRIHAAYSLHLERLFVWLDTQPHVQLLHVNFNELIEHPRRIAKTVRRFLDDRLELEAMTQVIEPALYRNRPDAAEDLNHE